MAIGEAADTSVMIAAAIARAGQLATLPEIAMEVMRVAEDPASTGDDLARVLANDPTLSARVLKVINSAFYGVRREVTSVGTAVGMLGFGAVKSIAIAASLTRMFRAGSVGGAFEARDLWTHSIAVATAARTLAQRSGGVEPSEAFLAGLMHDIGIVVEMQACREPFARVVAAVTADPMRSFRDAERAELGATHEEFGEALCSAWRFPVALQQVCGYHHRPMELPVASRGMALVVHVADHLAAMAGVGYARTVGATPLDPALPMSLALADTDLQMIADDLPSAVSEILPLLTGES